MEKNEKKREIVFKVIATMLITVILIHTNANIVSALSFNGGKKKELTTEEINQMEENRNKSNEEEREIIGEDINDRKLNQKTFFMNDGTRMVAMYPSNIHYEKDGRLVDIDNHLEEENGKIKNKEGSYQIQYAKQSSSEELATLTKGNYKIKWNIVENTTIADMTKQEENTIKIHSTNSVIEKYNTKSEKDKIHGNKKIKNVQAQIKNNIDKKKMVSNDANDKMYANKNQEKMNLDKISSQINYEEIMENIDLKYQNTADSIKESIIIKNKNAIQEKFIFQYEANNMIMELNENKEILVYDNEKANIIFKIEAPYMFDNRLNQSDKIGVTLKQERDYYIVEIIPDKKWLESEEREYPVTIDPTINTSLYYNDIKDTFIFKGDNNTPNRHKAHIIRVGSNNRLKEAPRGLIKFTLPELKAGDQVVSANLSICNYPDTEEWTPSPNEMQIDIHKMTADWDEVTANWDNCNNHYDVHITDYIKYKYDANSPFKFNYFNITAIVKDWYVNGNNYGVMLKDNIETYNYPYSDAYFLSANTHVEYIDGRPMIQIIYRNQTGLENNMTYHTQNVGRAGEVNTNDYNGNVVLTHADVETPGNVLSVSISHVYNTNNKDTDIGYGKGFRLNYGQEISLVTINKIEYAKYIDEDATEHYFKKKENNIYIDEDGLNLRLRLENNIFIMEDIQGNILRFKKINDKWFLYESENTEQQKITIHLDGNGKIVSIIDGAGKTVNLEYTNGKLSAIKDIGNRKMEYYYNSKGNLIQIKYFDNKSSYYEYDNLNLLTKVKNIDGYFYTYDYYRQKVNRVKKIKEYGINNEEGNLLDILYENNTTRFMNNQGYSNVYTFNNSGRTISIADFGKEGNNVNNAYGKMYKYGTTDENKNKLTLESNLICVKDMPNNLVKNPFFDEGLNHWEKQDNASSTECVMNIDNNNVYKAYGQAHLMKKLFQKVQISGKKGDVYNLSYWVKSFGLQEEGTAGKSVRITIGVVRKDDSIQWIDSFVNTDTSQWQYMAEEFITDSDYKAITLYLIDNYNANDTFWDNIGLFKDEKGNSYQYDKSGNIVSSKDIAQQESTFRYSSEGGVAKSINPKGGSYIYEYDYNHKNRLLKAVNTMGQKYSFDYDNKGNVIKSKVQETDKTLLPENGKTYQIKVANSEQILEVAGVSKDDGAKIQQWELVEGYDNKKFKFEEEEDGYFRIRAIHSNKVMDLDVSSGIIQQWYEANTNNQLWKAVLNSDGTIRIINKAKGDDYCLTLEKDNGKDGTKVIISKWNGKSTQKLRLYDIDGNITLFDEQIVESGEVYRLKAKNSGLYLEVSGDANTDSVEIKQQEYKYHEKKQLWRILRIKDGTYKFINLASNEGKALDVRFGENKNDKEIQIYQNLENNLAQEWKVVANTNGTFSIRSKLEGAERAITIRNNTTEIGANATIFEITGGANQSFYLEKADLVNINAGSIYKIKAKHSGKYIGVKSDNSLEQQDSNDKDSQKWILKKLNDGYYKIVSKLDQTKVIDIENKNHAEGTNINIFTEWGEKGENEAQEFEFVPVGDGSFIIKPRLTNGKRCLDVESASTASGAKIWSWSINNTSAQQFYLEEIIPLEEKKYIETTGKYSEDGRYLTKQTDEIGNEVNYEYDVNRGLITKEIDPNNKETIYTYDTNTDLTTQVSKRVGEKIYTNQYTYENDNIKAIKHNGINYEFIYDGYGNVKDIKVGNQSLKKTVYDSKNGNLLQSTYGNNQNIKYQYDRFNRIINKQKTTGNIEFSYDSKSNLKTVKDNTIGITTNYSYDLANRMTKAENNKGLTISYEYDDNSNINKTKYKLNDKVHIMNHNFDSDNNINSMLFNNSVVKINYDRLARGISKDIVNEKGIYRTEYGYVNTKTPNKTTTILESIKNGTDETIHYTYNNMGYIETIKKGNKLLAKYQYDELGQITREDNKEQGKTTTYEYDTGGNILNKKEYAYIEADITIQPTKVIEYIYNNANWKDQLTRYNGKEITYDAIGNPLSYDGNTYTWQNGRELASIQNTGKGLNISYKYTDNGIRTQKTVNGETTTYHLDGEIVIYEIKGNDTIYYQYDNSQNLIGFQLNDEQYYYIRNGQNDIIGILDNNLNQVVSYTYDTWGKLISIKDGKGNDITNNANHVGYKNPYRYRGYRYDTETGLYYLQSRYYNPEIGRFINQDELTSTGQGLLEHNMYAYCNNNPVNMIDTTGNVAGIISLGSSLINRIGKNNYYCGGYMVCNRSS